MSPGTTIPVIAAVATLGATILGCSLVQTFRGPLSIVGAGVVATAYIAAAFGIARQNGWRRVLSIGCALSSPLWIMGLYFAFAFIAVMLMLHDEALPGETAFQSYQDSARTALGNLLTAVIFGVWLTVLTVCIPRGVLGDVHEVE